MAFPTGVKFILPVIINKNLVSGALDNFLYQVDLTSYINQIAANVSELSEANIAVYDSTIDDVIPKYADTRSISDDKFILYFSGSTSNTVNRTFYICFGVDINVANSTNTFSNSGFTHYWGLNELSGNSTISYIGSRTGSTTDNVSLGGDGKFFKCASNTGTGTGRISFDNEIIGVGDRTFDFLFKVNSSGTGRIFTNSKCSLINGNYTFSITRNGSTYVGASANCYNKGYWYHATVTSTSDGVTNFYINGQLSGTPNQNAGTPSVASATNMIMMNRYANDTPMNGSIDEVGFTNNILSTDYITTRYNQYFNPSFWSYGSPMVISTPKKYYKYQYSISQ